MSVSTLSRRVLQTSSRRLTVQPAGTLRASAAALPTFTFNLAQHRSAASTSTSSAASAVSQSQASDLLAAQRRARPVSPHLSIYKWQATWIPSSLNRITGVTLSGTFYLFGMAYLAAPLFGWHLESASLAAAFASWPVLAKVALKAFYALPFTFHSLNGLRHLIWDSGAMLTNRQVIVGAYTVAGLSIVSALGLTFL